MAPTDIAILIDKNIYQFLLEKFLISVAGT